MNPLGMLLSMIMGGGLKNVFGGKGNPIANVDKGGFNSLVSGLGSTQIPLGGSGGGGGNPYNDIWGSSGGRIGGSTGGMGDMGRLKMLFDILGSGGSQNQQSAQTNRPQVIPLRPLFLNKVGRR